MPGECRARVAFGTPEDRNGIVYSAIGRSTDTRLCVVQVIGRVLRHVSVFLLDHGYVPLDCELRTVALHMQWHPGRGHWALKRGFEAWASEAHSEESRLQRRRAAAGLAPVLPAGVPAPPTRPPP